MAVGRGDAHPLPSNCVSWSLLKVTIEEPIARPPHDGFRETRACETRTLAPAVERLGRDIEMTGQMGMRKIPRTIICVADKGLGMTSQA